MSISIKTRRMLWGNSANICNLPDCKCQLCVDATENDDASVVGEECHIVARELNEPRGNSTLTEKQRDEYSNLILLCNVHHKLIDDQCNTYTVEKLKEMKQNHETWVKELLLFNGEKQKDDKIYLTYIEKWCELINIDNWNIWVSEAIGAGNSHITDEMNDKLYELKNRLSKLILPKRYTELNNAFMNFRLVLEDFYNLFHKHSEKGDNDFKIKRFYQIDEYNLELYNKLLSEYKAYKKTLTKVAIEFTKSGNYMCENIRKHIIPYFRLKEGVLSVTLYNCYDDNYDDIMNKEYCVEYCEDEISKLPYKGFKEL